LYFYTKKQEEIILVVETMPNRIKRLIWFFKMQNQ